MQWLEFHITTTAEHAPALSDRLILLGAQAVTLRDAGDQPIYEPDPSHTPLWEEVIVVGLFEENEPIDKLGHYLENQRQAGLIKKFELHTIADEDWTRRCLDSFKPMQFGKRLWICPSWLTPPDPNAVNIILDPGLAFGTGTHPTTALCLEWLDQHVNGQALMIDYGCGSGILSIAALKLGVKKVLAIDHDPQALEATRQNAERNDLVSFIPAEMLRTQLDCSLQAGHPWPFGGILPPVALCQSGFSASAGTIDLNHLQVELLVANILARPLIDFAPLFASVVSSGGKLLLSGILNTQIESVLEAYQPWFQVEEMVHREEWVRLAWIRK